MHDRIKRLLTKFIPAVCLCAFAWPAEAVGQVDQSGSVIAHVLDVGPGLCCAAKIPDKSGTDHYFVYDAGPNAKALRNLSDLIPEGSVIDLLILSHTHADHIGGAPLLLDRFKVKRVLLTTLRARSGSSALFKLSEALNRAATTMATEIINFSETPLEPGATFRIGEAYVTIVSGSGTPPDAWGLKNESDRINASSIVARLRFDRRTVLFGGDAVGRRIGDPPNIVLGTEAYMLQNQPIISLTSDVIIAPHHGSDGGSSGPLIAAVQPRFVIFSAGHRFSHPRREVAERYTQILEPDPKFFRTDRGDDEGDLEWAQERELGHKDMPWDDDVEIVLNKTGEIQVSYRLEKYEAKTETPEAKDE